MNLTDPEMSCPLFRPKRVSQMESGVTRTQRGYTLAFKLSVVEQVEKGQLAYKEVQRRYRIQRCSTVLIWLRKHRRQHWGANQR